MEGEQFKGCPFCGQQPEFKVLVEDHVWGGECANKWNVFHTYSVMSWTSLEHCQQLWNTRHGEENNG